MWQLQAQRLTMSITYYVMRRIFNINLLYSSAAFVLKFDEKSNWQFSLSFVDGSVGVYVLGPLCSLCSKATITDFLNEKKCILLFVLHQFFYQIKFG